MFKRLIAIAASLFAALTLFADEVEFAAAKEFAHAWRGRAVKGGRTHRDGAGTSRFHVVSFEGGGWAAVGVDDEEAPVIAFSDDGEDLVEDDKNPVWFLVKRDAERRAKARRGVEKRGGGGERFRKKHKGWERKRKGEGHGSVKSATATAKTAVSDSALEDIRVAPLLKSKWNQEKAGGYNTYNYYTPNHYYCGCVATMGAQMMRYFEWPKSEVEAKSYSCSVTTYDTTGKVTAQDYSEKQMMGGVYDWDIMDLCPSSVTTSSARKMIGKLCYDFGVAVSMDWSNNGSGAYMWFVREAFVDTFQYSHAELVVFNESQSSAYSLEKLKTIIIPNCEAGLPIGYGISGVSSDGYIIGHAVVIDGYGYSGDDFFVHINPGWSGSSNAWYNPPNLAMGGYSFDSSDELVYNVYKEGSGALVSGQVRNLDGHAVAGAVVSGTVNGKSFSTSTDANGRFVFKTGIDNKAVTLVATASKRGYSETLTSTLSAARTMRGNRADPYAQSEAAYILDYTTYSLGNKYDFNFTLPCHTTAPKVLFR